MVRMVGYWNPFCELEWINGTWGQRSIHFIPFILNDTCNLIYSEVFSVPGGTYSWNLKFSKEYRISVITLFELMVERPLLSIKLTI